MGELSSRTSPAGEPWPFRWGAVIVLQVIRRGHARGLGKLEGWVGLRVERAEERERGGSRATNQSACTLGKSERRVRRARASTTWTSTASSNRELDERDRRDDNDDRKAVPTAA